MKKVNAQINKASTLSSKFYTDPQYWEASKQNIFSKCWQLIGSDKIVQANGSMYPFHFIENYIDEPLLVVKDHEGDIKCLSNVCTHRGFILKHHPDQNKQIICKYHGRRFDLNGQMQFMPEFQDAADFPRACDHLEQIPLARWHQYLFCSLEPEFEWEVVAKVMDELVGFLPIGQSRFAPEFSKEYLVHAHWALYCDNYLEGFHIPFVHEGLNQYLDYNQYETVCFDYCNLQIGFAKSGEEVFDLPKSHKYNGRDIGAFYFWVFPNLMFNFYPWGLSINLVKPLRPETTKVHFLTYLWDEDLYHAMNASSDIDKVEREDEFVVEGVQRGLKSRYYPGGRFSPSREKGVHQFHSMLANRA